MGQGIYTMIGYGTTGLKLPVKADGYVMELSEVFGRKLATYLKQNYECEPCYLMVPVAISNEFLAEYWNLECFARRAFTVAELHSYYEADLEQAEARWRLAVVRARNRHGLKLSIGELLIVTDWN